MSLAVGPLSLVSSSGSFPAPSVALSCVAASGGTSPYTYQLYRSQTSGFTPGGGSLLTGATSLSWTDTYQLVPNTTYYYVMVVTDTGNSNATANSAQFAVTVPVPTLNQNQFVQSPFLGWVDLPFSYNTKSAIIDVTQATGVAAGQAVKVVNSVGGVPKVVAIAANTDEVWGFVNFDIKTPSFLAGYPCEISQKGNVMYLYATAAVTRGDQVQIDVRTPGGVTEKVGSSGACIVGFALDEATAPGQLIRVQLECPSFLFA